MGSSNSTALSDDTEGYNILKIQEGSPAQLAGLEAYFDFILAIGTTRLSQDNESMKTMLKNSVDQSVKLTVYSTRTNLCREVAVTPSTGWGGSGLLGVSIRFCSIRAAREAVWHILDVAPNSPAAQAGLISQHDYVIGSDAVLLESDDFFSLVETFDGRPLKLFVYNALLNASREIVLTPRSSWEGPGALGCGIGYGYLHRIPLFPTAPAPAHASVTAPVASAECTKLPPNPPPYSEKAPPVPEPAEALPQPAAAKTDGASVAANPVLPGMVTSVALPGLPPLNVTVPSFSLSEKSAGYVMIRNIFRSKSFSSSDTCGADASAQISASAAPLPAAVQS